MSEVLIIHKRFGNKTLTDRKRLAWRGQGYVAVASYLSVDGPNDGRSETHAGDKAVLEVLVQDDCLEDGTAEHEESQSETPP